MDQVVGLATYKFVAQDTVDLIAWCLRFFVNLNWSWCSVLGLQSISLQALGDTGSLSGRVLEFLFLFKSLTTFPLSLEITALC